MGRVTIHRGPDDEGAHADGPLAFGMRRLSIIDLDGGHQPLSTRTERCGWWPTARSTTTVSCARELTAQGHRFKTGSDCETMLHLYEEHGDEFVRHLNGMYAFALWDARRRRLLVGRDRLGVKPIYLLQRRPAPAVRQRGEGDSCRARHQAGARSVRAVVLSRPGLCARAAVDLRAVSASFRRQRCWSPKAGASRSAATGSVPARHRSHASEDEWTERVRARLEESVRMQMVSDVPIGAFLSGGIDSSAVVAFMSAHSDRPVKTYAIGFDGRRRRGLLQRAALRAPGRELFGTDHHEILVRPDVVSLLPRLLWHMDEPIADTAFITTYLVSEFARRDVTVILSGVGGDELFGGYRRYLGSHYQAYFERLPAWLRRAALALGGEAAERSPLAAAERDAPRKGLSRQPPDLPFEERYRSYVQVFSARRRGGAAAQRRSAEPDPLAAAFRAATSDDDLNRMLARRCRDAAARRPAAAHRQDEHGGVARMPRAAAGPGARRAGRANARRREGPRRPAEARDEGGAPGRAARRHPVPEEARLRRAHGRMAQGRSRAVGA